MSVTTMKHSRKPSLKWLATCFAIFFGVFVTALMVPTTAEACPQTYISSQVAGETYCSRPPSPGQYALGSPFIQGLLAAEAEAAADAADAAQAPGAKALSLFYYSMGRGAGGTPIPGGMDTCLTCDFITYFLIAMAQFSAALYSFFAVAFFALAPILIAMWIAVRVIQLNFNGGASGGTFFMDLIKKLTLLFFSWLLFTGAVGIVGPSPDGDDTSYYAGPTWVAAGPELLRYSFLLNNDVRSQTAAGLMSVGVGLPDSSPFECGNLDDRVRGMVDDPAIDPAVVEVTTTACVVERMHILGIATSVALLTSAWNQLEFSFAGMLASIMKTIWGLILIAIFGLSAVWLVFVLLDVVVKALIVAAFLPIFGLAFLFKPTRQVAQNAFMQLISVPVVAFALGLTSLLGFYLITATPTVYNNTYEMMSPVFQRPLVPIAATDTVERFAEFIQRIQLDPQQEVAIPTYISSPWLIYIMLVGLGIFSLGKKVISIIEQIMGVQGTTELANNAKKLATQGTLLGLGTAAVGMKAAQMAAPAVGIAGGATLGAGGAMLGRGAQMASGDRFGNNLAKGGGWLARKSAGAGVNRYTPFGRDGRMNLTGRGDKE